MKFYPYEKRGLDKVLAILKGGRKMFPLFKKKRGGEREKFYPVLMGGGHKKFRTRNFPIL